MSRRHGIRTGRRPSGTGNAAGLKCIFGGALSKAAVAAITGASAGKVGTVGGAQVKALAAVSAGGVKTGIDVPNSGSARYQTWTRRRW